MSPKDKLRKNFREMVVYLLDDEAAKNNEIVDSYTDTFMDGATEFSNEINNDSFERALVLQTGFKKLKIEIGKYQSDVQELEYELAAVKKTTKEELIEFKKERYIKCQLDRMKQYQSLVRRLKRDKNDLICKLVTKG